MKIKVLKIDRKYKNWSDYDYSESASQGITKWDEVTLEEYQRINDAVIKANQRKNENTYYFIVQEVENNAEIFEKATDFAIYLEEIERKRREKEKEQKQKREAAKIQRKKKQLEKLQKELSFNG